MMKYIKQGLALSIITDKKIRTNDISQLECLKDRLMDRLGSPIGWHTSGVPMVFSMIFALTSFSLQQGPLWLAVFRWLDLPKHTVFAGIFPSLAIFCIVIVSVLMATSRGYLSGLKLYLLMIALTALGSVVIFIIGLISALLALDGSYARLVGAGIGLIAIILSIRCLNSVMFVRSIAWSLHNRVWRKQLKIQARGL